MGTKKPKMIVFDLDYTLWPFWVDTHFEPPFKKSGEQLKDRHGQTVKCYKDVLKILENLHTEGYILGVASKTCELDGATQLLSLWDWEKYFSYKEIYPGCKIKHFEEIKKKSGIDFKDMLFFDDELRNVTDLKRIGVLTILVKKGISIKLIDDGLQQYRDSR